MLWGWLVWKLRDAYFWFSASAGPHWRFVAFGIFGWTSSVFFPGANGER